MKKKQQQLLVLFLVIVIGGASVYFIGDAIGLWAGEPATTTPTTKATSTFTFIDYNTGEDVSPWVEGSIWTPDPDDIPFDDSEDIFRIANFDEDVSSQDAGDIAIDLRSHDYAWLQIDPDYESDYGGYAGVFATPTTDDFRLLIGGANYDYIFYVFHEPTDIDINILDRGRGLNVWNVSRLAAGTVDNVLSDNINGTIVLDLPWNNTAGIHAGTVGGDGWNIDDDELDDMLADFDPITLRYGAELEWLYSQRNFRTIAPYYDLADDNSRNYDDNLEKWTNCFAIEFGFNATINATDAHDAFTVDTQINFTLYEQDWIEEKVEIIASGAQLYVIYYAPIICYPEPYCIDFEIILGGDINVSTVRTGRIFTPEGRNNLGAFTVYSAMQLRDYIGLPM